MKKKTEERLRKRWERLPAYFIDASVVLEVLLEDRYQYECKSFLNQIGHKYRGMLSVSVLGEIDKVIFGIEENVSREIARDFVDRLILRHGINVASLTYETYSMALKIRELNSYVKSMDALHIACAVENEVRVFATLDNELIKSGREIGRQFDIKIKHPSEL